MAASKESRQHARVKTDRLVWRRRDWESEPVALLDISGGGMLCELSDALAPDEELDLDFELPGVDRLIHCRCRAIHSRKQENGFHLTGLAIVQLDDMSKEELARRIQSVLAARATEACPHPPRDTE